MGGGGRMEKEVKPDKVDPLRRAPHEKPPFTLSQLKKAIPPHCFKRSALRSFAYLAQDLFAYVALLYLALYQLPSLPPNLRLVAWPIYWFAQGSVLTALWNLGHECGHNLFSESGLLDDVIGLVLHSFVLVPYFSWKYSHQRHHTHRGSIERDEVFVPKPRQSLAWYAKYFNNPPGRVLTLALTILLGWPLYLAVNASGRPYPSFASHYHPYGPIYNPSERVHVFISDAGIFAVLFLLYKAAMAAGFWFVVRIYWVPYLVVNGWLVFITSMHHTHPSLPHYDSTAWDWFRGALATVDRDYGVFNRMFHHITDAHFVHHIISTIPYYHAKEATEAIRPILGDYYRFDDTPVLKAFWREARECVYVEQDADGEKGVYWYRKNL